MQNSLIDRLFLAPTSSPGGGRSFIKRRVTTGPSDTTVGSVESGSRIIRARRKLGALTAAALCLAYTLIFLSPVATASRAGDLDPAFGEGGRVLEPQNGKALAIARTPDGKVVAAGCMGRTCQKTALARYLPDGRLDAGFGEGGLAQFDFTPEEYEPLFGFEGIAAVAVRGSPGSYKITAAGEFAGRFGLAQFNSDGTRDPGFGDNGLALGPGGSAAALTFHSGKWIAAGRTVAGGSQGDDFMVAAFDASNGALDPAFGSGGVAIIDAGETDGAEGVAANDDGIFAVGYSGPGHFSDRRVAVIRLNHSGALVDGFDLDGKFIGPPGSFSSAVVHDAGGGSGIAAAGRIGERLGVMRFTPEGLDARFGTAGSALGPTGRASALVAQGAALVAAGRTVASEGHSAMLPSPEGWDMLLVRFTGTGSVDDSFGSGGSVVTDMGEATDEAAAVALDPSDGGRILVAGYSGQFSFRFTLARFRASAQTENVSLRVSLSGSTNPVQAGAALDYQIDVSNGGPQHAHAARLQFALPGPIDFHFVDTTHGVCSREAEMVNCQLGGILAGEKATVSATVTPTAPGTLTASASVMSNSTDGNPSDDSSTLKTTVVPGEGLFQSGGELAQPSANHSATLLTGPLCRGLSQPSWCGKVLIVKGKTSELYDPATNTWTAVADPLEIDHDRFHTATLLSDGKVLVVGGRTLDENERQHPVRAELYDPATGATGEWSLTEAPTQARSGHVAVRLTDGRVMVAGGRGDKFSNAGCTDGTPGEFAALKSVEIFDPQKKIWESGPDMPTRRASTEAGKATATLLPGGQVLVVGGSKGIPWLDAGPAGRKPEICDRKGPLAPGEIFDPALGWHDTGGPEIPRHGHEATLLENGTVLITGGNTTVGDVITTPSAFIYDPKDTSSGRTGTWKSTDGLMIHGRQRHAASRLPNGKVLLTGGQSRSRPNLTYMPRSAELFDPKTARFTSAGITRQALDHTATTLPPGPVSLCGGNCGKVLLAGGESPPGLMETIIGRATIGGDPLDLSPGPPVPVRSSDLYVSPPAVSHLTPDEGPVSGNTDVTISGVSLSSLSKVTFEGQPPMVCGKKGEAKCWVDEEFPDLKVHMLSPPRGAPQHVQVVVETLRGLTGSGLFRYVGDDLPGGGSNDGLGENAGLAQGGQNSPPVAPPPGTTSAAPSSSATATNASALSPPKLPPGNFAPSAVFAQSPQAAPQVTQGIQASAAAQAGLRVQAQPQVSTGLILGTEEEPHPAPRISFSSLEESNGPLAWAGALSLGAAISLCFIEVDRRSAASVRAAPAGAGGWRGRQRVAI